MLSHIQGPKGRPREALFRLLAVLGPGLLLLIIAAGLAACGSSSGGSANSTPTVSTSVQKCGTVQTRPRGEPADPTTARQAADCFWRAFQQCHLASLTYAESGVDTIAIHTFTIQNNGAQCTVVDVMKHQVVPQPPPAAKTYTCSRVTQQANGLLFASCGAAGNITVPTTASPKYK